VKVIPKQKIIGAYGSLKFISKTFNTLEFLDLIETHLCTGPFMQGLVIVI
jgi:hypothetical protein